MGTQAEELNNEEVVLEQTAEEQNLEGEENLESVEGDDADEVVVTIGDATPEDKQQEQAPEWVRELRKNYRELQKENKQLKEKVQPIEQANKPKAPGAKPTLEAHDYDSDKYEAALDKWYNDKKVYDDAEARAQSEKTAQEQAWQTKLADYNTKKAGLKVKDFDEAESLVRDMFSVTQQGIMVQGSENSATLTYALGKNPEKLKELAAITDPVKFSFAVAKLETTLKVTNRKSAPTPERRIGGGGGGNTSGAVDSVLEKLRAEAAKTGDLTKVVAYNRQKRQASQK